MTGESVKSQKMPLIAHDTLIVGVRSAYNIYVDSTNRHIDVKIQYNNNAKCW